MNLNREIRSLLLNDDTKDILFCECKWESRKKEGTFRAYQQVGIYGQDEKGGAKEGSAVIDPGGLHAA
jgi:hypothetical protein